MKVIVLMIVMTMYGCSTKVKVSCNINDINTGKNTINGGSEVDINASVINLN